MFDREIFSLSFLSETIAICYVLCYNFAVKGLILLEVPRYIRDSLDKRKRAAEMFNKYDLIVSQWCMNNSIELEDYDCFGGVEAIVNPNDSKKTYFRSYRKSLSKKGKVLC